MSRMSSIHVAGALAALAAGCAPSQYGEAVRYYAEQHHVTDAAARQAKGFWFLRFNELILSDLDEAIRAGESGDPAEMHRQAAQVIRAARSFAVQSAAGEIDRLPPEGRAALASRSHGEPSAETLKTEYIRQSEEAMTSELQRIETATPRDALSELKKIRARVEPAPDDRGRAGRQLLLAWGALPAGLGIEMVESELEKTRTERMEKVYEQAAIWRPRTAKDADLLQRHAPTIAIEWPLHRDYPADYDRFGEIFLTGDPRDVQVNVNTSRPFVYTYRSEAKIGGTRHTQLSYVWWYPFHPHMKKNDPAAGRIDGDTLRVTLDSHDRPAVFEVIQSCGCGHLIFISEQLEQQARQEFGSPEPGKTLCVEHDVSGKRDLIVMGTVRAADDDPHLVVYVVAGYHEVSGIDFETRSRRLDVKAAEQHEYDLGDYDVLERLPLKGGVASMFGPDGLVHNARRTEGYLLAPTGILSAGQPRKRGTQKIRWDEFSFDDPHLLEKALRFPSSF